jgi:hypothetical protein
MNGFLCQIIEPSLVRHAVMSNHNYLTLNLIYVLQVAEEYYGGMDWSRIICIDTEGGTSTCNGDSGGPLMTAEGRLTGVTSFGSIFGCEVGAPACFSAVPSYLDFINENL